MAVDVERSRVDKLAVNLEAVRISYQVQWLNMGLLSAQGLQTIDGKYNVDVAFELFLSIKLRTLRANLLNINIEHFNITMK